MILQCKISAYNCFTHGCMSNFRCSTRRSLRNETYTTGDFYSQGVPSGTRKEIIILLQHSFRKERFVSSKQAACNKVRSARNVLCSSCENLTCTLYSSFNYITRACAILRCPNVRPQSRPLLVVRYIVSRSSGP